MKHSRLTLNPLVFLTSFTSTLCFGQVAESEQRLEALPEHLIYLYTSEPSSTPDNALSQLFGAGRLWEPGRTLRVCLFQGNEVVAALIRGAATEWNQYSSVKFDFGPSTSWYNCLSPRAGFFEIRIGFSAPGYWSAVGKDSEARVDSYAPSMNFESFNRLYSPSRYVTATVLQQAKPYDVHTIKHEFGHALGLLHEHQNPALNCTKEIKWEGPGNVYEYLGGPPNNWSREQVQRNLGFIGQTDPDFRAGAPDTSSVMFYSLPEKIFSRGTLSPCYVAPNFAISAKDRQVVARIYSPVNVGSLSSANDLDTRSAQVRPLAASAAPAEILDNKQRIVADLDSDDTFTRRNARARLSLLLPQLTEAETSELVATLSVGSYRAQLGLVTAIAKAPAGLKLAPQAKTQLAKQAKNARDVTLRREATAAAKRFAM